MNLNDYYTPCVLVDHDKLMKNIQDYQAAAAAAGKELWPMIKTHKCSLIAKLQKMNGAAGFLAGTLRECEVLLDQKLGPVMFAYPTSGALNIAKALSIGKKGRMIYSLDGEANSRQLSEGWLAQQEADRAMENWSELDRDKQELEVMLIVDSGLHRFGIQPELAGSLGSFINSLPGLKLAGISTHPGQVYAVSGPREIAQVAAAEEKALRAAYEGLKRKGIQIRYIAAGSTPTFHEELKSPLINILRPGNYVFHDQIQISLMGRSEEDCSLSVLATVIARPSLDRLMIDAGSKVFALDKGAHAIPAVEDYGQILGHPELKLVSLSEEVGKVAVEKGVSAVKVGDKLRIIPNHACPVSNLVDELNLVRGEKMIGTMPVNMKHISY
ncbi:MAG: alanine racemase [Peptococcaceae bacterium]|nr:alanine racemase [Peptococcaceae bacterium]